MIQHDCSNNVSHTTDFFLMWKSLANVIVKVDVFLRLTLYDKSHIEAANMGKP